VSPLRKGSANNVYVIPAPTRLTFGTATLLSGACGIWSALILVSLWNRIVQFHWRTRFGDLENLTIPGEKNVAAPISEMQYGTMQHVGRYTRKLLEVVKLPLLSAAAPLPILILGEISFFSAQVRFENDLETTFGERYFLDVRIPLNLWV
jgi:hypothetical protein